MTVSGHPTRYMCCWSDSPCCWSDSPWHVRDNQHRPLPHQSVNIIHVKPNPARLQPAPATQIRYDEAAYSYVLRTLDYCSYTPAASGWAHALVTRNRFSAMVTQHNIEYIALPDQNKYSNHKCQDTRSWVQAAAGITKKNRQQNRQGRV